MLPEKHFQFLYPFFSRYEYDLLQLKASSIETYNNSKPLEQHDQLFYPWGQRKIFHLVKFQQKQINAINEVKSLIIENEKFQVNHYSNENILRYLHSSQLNVKKAYERLAELYQLLQFKNADKTFLKYLQKDNYQKLQTHLKSGLIYTLGKSHSKGLPIVILQVKKIDTTLSQQQNFSTFFMLISTVLNYRMRPHFQQKYIFLIDLGCLSFSQIPYKYTYKFMHLIALVFQGLCEKILVYNSQKIGLLWHICKQWLPQSTIKKITFVQKNTLQQVFQLIDPNQLQTKYGGQVNDICQYWPPKPISFHRSKLYKNETRRLKYQIEQQDNQTQYLSFKSISRFQEVKKYNDRSFSRKQFSFNTLNKSKNHVSFYNEKQQYQFQEEGEKQFYQIEKQQFGQKISNFCSAGKENCQCTIF